MIWGTVGVMGGLAYRGTVMCLLDNGTESATKRFTGSFAFSAACRPGGAARLRRAVRLDRGGGKATRTHSAAQVHSSNSLAPNR
ncbi:hypothetical protein DDE05_51930 [Streptomyces cavourensis]|nr:hypothetical protein DDE05_51930 [Streptomyces cavourensis]